MPRDRDSVHTETLHGLTLRIEYDTDPESPREWDNAGTMVCWHRNYNLGDEGQGYGKRVNGLSTTPEFPTPQHFKDWWDGNKDEGIEEHGKGGLAIPMFMYDHSGITVWAGSRSSGAPGTNCPWDSGQIGYIYITRDTILKEWGTKINRVTKKMLEQARKRLMQETETYDEFLTGQVYGYEITGPDGDHLDSCWGFYGLDYCKEEALSSLKFHAKALADAAQHELDLDLIAPCAD